MISSREETIEEGYSFFLIFENRFVNYNYSAYIGSGPRFYLTDYVNNHNVTYPAIEENTEEGAEEYHRLILQEIRKKYSKAKFIKFKTYKTITLKIIEDIL